MKKKNKKRECCSKNTWIILFLGGLILASIPIVLNISEQIYPKGCFAYEDNSPNDFTYARIIRNNIEDSVYYVHGIMGDVLEYERLEYKKGTWELSKQLRTYDHFFNVYDSVNCSTYYAKKDKYEIRKLKERLQNEYESSEAEKSR